MYSLVENTVYICKSPNTRLTRASLVYYINAYNLAIVRKSITESDINNWHQTLKKELKIKNRQKIE